jgi:hypothetical protein
MVEAVVSSIVTSLEPGAAVSSSRTALVRRALRARMHLVRCR